MKRTEFMLLINQSKDLAEADRLSIILYIYKTITKTEDKKALEIVKGEWLDGSNKFLAERLYEKAYRYSKEEVKSFKDYTVETTIILKI